MRGRSREGVVDEQSPLRTTSVLASFCSIVPTLPLIGSLGGGGAVVPLVKSITAGLESEPM